jgi:hypothetical protein
MVVNGKSERCDGYGFFLDAISDFLRGTKDNYKSTLLRIVGIRPTFEREAEGLTRLDI